MNAAARPECRRQRHNPSGRRGMTLVEVMIATVLFTLMALSLTAAYIQNMRMSKIQVYRTQAINTAMSLLEQIRFEGHRDILDKYYSPEDPAPLIVRLIDPSNTTTEPTGYRAFSLPINERDGEVLETEWSATEIDISGGTDPKRLPVRFWLSLVRDRTTTQPVYDVFQLVLIYQWKTPTGSGTWETGNFRIVVPKLTVEVNDAT